MTDPVTPELRDLLTLHLVPGLGPRLTAALLEHFGSAAAVLAATADQLHQVSHIGPKLTAALLDDGLPNEVEEELKLIAQHQVYLRVLGQPDYPASLTTIVDAPYLLYVRGTLLPQDSQAVGLVGTRHPTPYGKRVAEKLTAGLVRAGFTVISGMAYGIDAAAHRAALQAGGRTLAVLAGGLTRIYPRDHMDLSREIAISGALITESNMRQEPMAGLFPARNRIISGLSRAVVIIEAAERSGALITASHAAVQGKPVLAVPGPIDSEQSGGCHGLIRKGAVLCRSVDDILEELNGLGSMPSSQRTPAGTATTSAGPGRGAAARLGFPPRPAAQPG